MNPKAPFSLIRKQGRVCLRRAGEEEIPVRIAWVRPLTARGGGVSFLDEKKKEVALLASLDALDPESAGIVREELAGRYLLPRIVKVRRTHAEFGTRYWDVDTDAGRRTFAMRDPHKNLVWIGEDRVILRDTIGNTYEIESLAGLDKRSRMEVDKVV
ncbi:MAG: DUF1854 domain-containing protein [Kiritimatiellae bacterium]|nr:DUF1854 domain-containing protein [Kiritimatiellia bacterium]